MTCHSLYLFANDRLQFPFDLAPADLLQVGLLPDDQDRTILRLRVAGRSLELQHHVRHFWNLLKWGRNERQLPAEDSSQVKDKLLFHSGSRYRRRRAREDKRDFARELQLLICTKLTSSGHKCISRSNVRAFKYRLSKLLFHMLL